MDATGVKPSVQWLAWSIRDEVAWVSSGRGNAAGGNLGVKQPNTLGGPTQDLSLIIEQKPRQELGV